MPEMRLANSLGKFKTHTEKAWKSILSTSSFYPSFPPAYGWMKLQRSIEGFQQGVGTKGSREEETLSTSGMVPSNGWKKWCWNQLITWMHLDAN
jgi:hypothetical protein